MAAGLPPLADFCVPLSLGPGELCIQFPSGVKLCAQSGFDAGDANEITRSLMAQVNSALMPLAPFFTVLDFVKAVTDFVKGVPEAIATLNPEPIVSPIVDIGKAAAKLLSMIPQLSVPILIKNILEVVVVQMIGLRGELAALISFQTRLLAAGTRAAELGNLELQAVVDCATGNLSAQLANHNAAMAPLNRLMGVINLLLGMAGLPEIELLPSLGEDVSSEVLDVIDGVVDVLEAVVASLPV